MARTIGIIGSGIGSLAAGIRLLSQGYQVTIFEARKMAGGKAAGVEVEGHLLDSGPTILRMPQLLLDIFAVTGHPLDTEFPARILSPHYRVYQKPSTYLDITANARQNTENISRFSSADANQYQNFLEHTQNIYQQNLTPPPVEKPERKPLVRLRPKEVLPIQPSVFQETQRFFQNHFIRQAFSFHPLLFGRNPFTAHYRSLMLLAIEQRWGILHVEGGFHQITRRLIDHFIEMGGQLLLNTPIEEIIIHRHKASILRLSSGKQMPFDFIISNISPYQTQQMLFTHKEPPAHPASRQSTSYFMLHILHNTELELQPHTILTASSYGASMQEVFNQNKLPADPWLYLYTQRPLNNDLKPLMVMTPVPNLGSPIDWGQSTFRFRNRVVEKINRFFPHFAENIHYERISTPQTFQEEYNLPGGSALFPPIRRGIPNLYYVGDNTWTGLGLIAVLSSAEQVAKTILTDTAKMV